FDRSLILFGLPGSEILRAGRAAGLRVAAEVFADRAYEADGSLASRRKPGAVIDDADAVVARAIRMVKERTVVALDRTAAPLDAHTICVHGAPAPGPHGQGAAGRPPRRDGGAARRRYHLRPRRHAGIGRSSRPNPGRARR